MSIANGHDQIGKVFITVSQRVRRCLICDRPFSRKDAVEHARTICYPSAGDSGIYGEAKMQIGKPLRTIVVEPLELPLDDPQARPQAEPIPQQEPTPEEEPAQG
jgi:hypothetical protein